MASGPDGCVIRGFGLSLPILHINGFTRSRFTAWLPARIMAVMRRGA
ncbi:hypothetical protein BwSH14_77010 [Bradyrhizobium ottawaense]|nr:hypothetical protein BwSH14_77010 [Bradyrhizobium ottawaense]GMO88760.1 hypothetical protein BwSG20_78300 [Bradyrhizobium ottawaense]GMP21389.1 hypothetical protein BwSH12_73990 [Bradyrhizobium ottawaense]